MTTPSVLSAEQSTDPVLSFDAETHTYTLHAPNVPSAWGQVLPSVTQVIEQANLIEDAEYFTEQSRERGRAVHKMILFEERDGLDESSVDPRLRGYFDAYRRFIAEAQPGPCELVEYPLYDPVLSFAGTPDNVRPFQGRRALFDIKSGAAERWHAVQTGAYEALVRQHLDCGPLARYGLYLRTNGTYKLEAHTDRRDWKVFQACLVVARFKEGK